MLTVGRGSVFFRIVCSFLFVFKMSNISGIHQKNRVTESPRYVVVV